ncbi:uncharacterized protein JCM15063_001024 [Sporobolomyces koalae]|uniref:uncharacterized protein n=1 Tax=Sporobolomyces koalae TaxID=500713 RepID=UPI00316D0BDA
MSANRFPSFSLGSPGVTREDVDERGGGAEILEKALRQAEARKRKSLEKQQEAILDRATTASKQYQDRIEQITKDAERNMTDVVEHFKQEETRMKDELAATEQALIQLMQTDCSDAKLASASILAAIEEIEQSRAAVIEALDTAANYQADQGHALLQDLWSHDSGEQEEGPGMQAQGGQAQD